MSGLGMSLVTAPDIMERAWEPHLKRKEILDHHDHLISDSGLDDAKLA